jgi:hypothetical protein
MPVVPIVCRSDARRRGAHGFQADVVMSGVVDSGREGGHGITDLALERQGATDTRALADRQNMVAARDMR